MPKSTNRYQCSIGISFLIIFITTLAAANGQSECAAKAFPSVIPMRINESLVINLQDYFEGSNISYAVTPNNRYSNIDNTFECQEKANQNEGKIIASHFLSQQELEIQSNLIDAGANTYILTYLLTNTFKITSLQLPKQNYTNCSQYALRLLNQTYIQAVVNCLHSQLLSTSVLLTMVATLYSKDPVWNFLSVPFFASDATNSPQLLLSNKIFLRGVSSKANSYIEIWYWGEQVKQLLGVADRTLLDVSQFDLRWMQLHGNALIVLDYNWGLHVLRVTKERKFVLIGSISQPYFQLFTYNPASGTLYLAKKGKVVSALLKNLDSKNIVTGSSFNLYAYQTVKQIVVSDQKLVVLGENIISVFALSDRSSFRHYNLYNSQGTAAFFQLNRPNEPLTLILPKQRQGVIRYYTCAVRSPLLRLYTPSGAVQVRIMGYSRVSGDVSTCRQNFTVKPMETDLDLIYDNGYRADNEVLFANLPGSGIVELQKYGAGRNMRYQVSKDPQSKIDYVATVRKQQSQQCTIQNRQIPPNGYIYYSRTWENLLITQLSSDFSLKYFFCRLQSGATCTYAVEIPSMKPVDLSAYELIDKTITYSISYEALLQQNGNNLNVLVRKLIVLNIAEHLQISVFCTIKIDDFMQQFANITQIEIKNGRLFLLMPFRKQIRVYDLVDGTCPLLISLTSSTFPDSYFAPRSLHFDQIPTNERQQIIFIRQWDQLLTVRLVGSPLAVSLLSKNKLQQVKDGSLVITRPYVVYFSDTTNKVDVYRLDDSHQLQYLRQLSLQGLQFSSSGKNNYYSVLDYTHLALRLINPATSAQFLKIFAIDELISVASEYLSISLAKEDQVATFFSPSSVQSKQLIFLQLLAGPSTAFILCRSFKIYIRPSILFSFTAVRSTSDSYSENVTLTLATADYKVGHKFKISLSNVGLALTRGPTFPRKGASVEAASQIFFEDSNWFSGSIYNYQFDCNNCNDRIKFIKKINMDSQSQLPLTSKKFLLDKEVKRIQAVTGPFLVEMHLNHTPWPLSGDASAEYCLSRAIVLSSGASECIDAIQIPEKNVILALCFRLNSENRREYILSLVSTVSMSYFVVTQSTLSLEDDTMFLKLSYKDDLIVVYSSNIAILLVIWEIEDILQLIELDVIDQEDISDSICALELISNATSHTTPVTSILYGLLLTQCSSSLYYTSFSIYINKKQTASYNVPSIHVSYSQNINIIKALSQKRIQIPTDARIIQTITKTESSVIEIEEIFSFFIFFDRFHSYKFKLVTSKQGRIIKSISVDAIFYKFGANTAVSAQLQTYLVVKYVLDLGFGKLQQLYGCFDLNKYLTNKDQVKEYYTFAADIFKKFQQLSATEEDFPWIMRGHRIFHLHNDRFEVLSLNSNLVANITGLEATDSESQVLYTQNIIITANNPISARSASIILRSVDKSELSDLQIALVVIGSIVLLVVLIILGRIFGRKIKKKLKLVPLSQNASVEDVVLEDEEAQRAGQWLINKSDRGSMEP